VNKELSIKELKHMLIMANKEIALKDKKIANLEEYIEALEPQLGDKADRAFINEAKDKL